MTNQWDEKMAQFRRENPFKFAPKLTLELRCAALAAYHMGFTCSVIAEWLGVHARTVQSIYRDNSRHYREVRQLYINMGRDDFMSKHMSNVYYDQLMSVAAERKRAAAEHVARTVNFPYINPRAVAHAGRFKPLDVMWNIVWVQEGELWLAGMDFGSTHLRTPGGMPVREEKTSPNPQCWAVVDESVPKNPDGTWGHAYGPYPTSTAAYNAAKEL